MTASASVSASSASSSFLTWLDSQRRYEAVTALAALKSLCTSASCNDNAASAAVIQSLQSNWTATATPLLVQFAATAEGRAAGLNPAKGRDDWERTLRECVAVFCRSSPPLRSSAAASSSSSSSSSSGGAGSAVLASPASSQSSQRSNFGADAFAPQQQQQQQPQYQQQYVQEQQKQQQPYALQQQQPHQIPSLAFVPVFDMATVIGSFANRVPRVTTSAHVSWRCFFCSTYAYGHRCSGCGKSRDSAALRVFVGQLCREGAAQMATALINTLCNNGLTAPVLHIEEHTHRSREGVTRPSGCVWVHVNDIADAWHLCRCLHKRVFVSAVPHYAAAAAAAAAGAATHHQSQQQPATIVGFRVFTDPAVAFGAPDAVPSTGAIRVPSVSEEELVLSDHSVLPRALNDMLHHSAVVAEIPNVLKHNEMYRHLLAARAQESTTAQFVASSQQQQQQQQQQKPQQQQQQQLAMQNGAASSAGSDDSTSNNNINNKTSGLSFAATVGEGETAPSGFNWHEYMRSAEQQQQQHQHSSSLSSHGADDDNNNNDNQKSNGDDGREPAVIGDFDTAMLRRQQELTGQLPGSSGGSTSTYLWGSEVAALPKCCTLDVSEHPSAFLGQLPPPVVVKLRCPTACSGIGDAIAAAAGLDQQGPQDPPLDQMFFDATLRDMLASQRALHEEMLTAVAVQMKQFHEKLANPI